MERCPPVPARVELVVDPDMLADLVGVLHPALTALAEGPKERAAAAFLQLEKDVAWWAVRHNVRPETLEQIRIAFRQDQALRRAVLDTPLGPARRPAPRANGRSDVS